MQLAPTQHTEKGEKDALVYGKPGTPEYLEQAENDWDQLPDWEPVTVSRRLGH